MGMTVLMRMIGRERFVTPRACYALGQNALFTGKICQKLLKMPANLAEIESFCLKIASKIYRNCSS
jgi:hypothetical protein